MRRIVISGAAGLVGSRALILLRESCEVHAIVRNPPVYPLEGVTYHVRDLGASWSTDGLPSRVFAVFHLAQSENFRDFPAGAMDCFRVNTAATAQFLDYAVQSQAQRFVLASTGGLYGSCDATITEQTPLNLPVGKLNYYFSTKLSAEFLSAAYRSVLDVTVLRPFFIYGAGQASDKLVQRLIDCVIKRRPITVVGENGTEMNPVHVDDVARLLAAVLQMSGSQTLNVAGPQIVSVRQIADTIASRVAVGPVLIHTDGHPERMVSSFAAAQALIAQPLTTFDEGIETMLIEPA